MWRGPGRGGALSRDLSRAAPRRLRATAQHGVDGRQPPPAHALRVPARRDLAVQQARSGQRLRGAGGLQPRSRDPGHERALHRHPPLRRGGSARGVRRGRPHGGPGRRGVDRVRRLLPASRRNAGTRASAGARRADRRHRGAGRADRAPFGLSEVPRPAVVRIRAGVGRGGARNRGRGRDQRAAGVRWRGHEAVARAPSGGRARSALRRTRRRSGAPPPRSSRRRSSAATTRSRSSSPRAQRCERCRRWHGDGGRQGSHAGRRARQGHRRRALHG